MQHRLDSLGSGNAARSTQTKTWSVTLGLVATMSSAWACSGVGPPGVPVVFGNQTNIIIWDEAHHTEHFIRNANFQAGATDFGFIAPTPGKPDLSESSSQAFYTLANLGPRFFLGNVDALSSGRGDHGEEPVVKVIQEADVAGYHATTLWSKDAHAINDWMNQHGYVSTPEVEKWADRYTKRGWYLTAFKVTDKAKFAASTGTVRMSFRTQTAFNPFYVPSSNIPTTNAGTLRVYFVSQGDYEARIGFLSTWQTPQWSADIPKPTADQLAKQVKLPASAIPEKAEVETFVDNNFPRPAPDDIYFTKRVPAPVIEDKAPGLRSGAQPPSPILALVAFAGIFAVTRRRKDHSQSE